MNGRGRPRGRRIGLSGRAARLAASIAPPPKEVPATRRLTRTEPPGPSAVDAPDEESSHPPDVKVRLLGEFEVLLGEARVRSWGGRRIRTVFQYLLVQDRPVRREILMDFMWPGHTYDSARGNLNVCLYGLRRVLGAVGGGDYVVYRDGSYGLNRDLVWSVDLKRFTSRADRMSAASARGDLLSAILHGQAAIIEYGGPLLDGEPADWCAEHRANLAESYIRTLLRVAELQMCRGDVAAAEVAAQRLLEEDPCREAAHRLLMLVFAERGERDCVARQFRRCVDRLNNDLDVPPSAETVELYRSLTAAR